MPPGGVDDRANQTATLSRLAHERFTSARMVRLLEAAEAEAAGLPPDPEVSSLLRVTRRDVDLQTRVPADLVADMARAAAQAQPVWHEAKAAADWPRFVPSMERTVELMGRLTEALGYEERPYDALIEATEPGLSTSRVEALFAEIRTAITPLVAGISAHADRVDATLLERPCDEKRQLAFALDVITCLGYDLERGRQDISAHPFCTAFGPGDVRLTTRTGPTLGDSCLYSSIHEAGHAMYNQGIPRSLDRTPLWGGASSGVHESQSRLWENLVGRSRPFADWLVPRLRAAFPETLGDVEPEPFWRAINRVRPSYIRVDADEITYNLHILLRFQLENDLLEERLRVTDVPDAWAAQLQGLLGLERPNDREGPLQDIHWTDTLGEFVGYTLGNLISAQLMEAARRDLPDLEAGYAAGEFEPLLSWLRDRVHRHGRSLTPDELVEQATGQPISAGPWIAYVREKFTALYDL
jgi:carboxypeptidase Taq